MCYSTPETGPMLGRGRTIPRVRFVHPGLSMVRPLWGRRSCEVRGRSTRNKDFGTRDEEQGMRYEGQGFRHKDLGSYLLRISSTQANADTQTESVVFSPRIIIIEVNTSRIAQRKGQSAIACYNPQVNKSLIRFEFSH